MQKAANSTKGVKRMGRGLGDVEVVRVSRLLGGGGETSFVTNIFKVKVRPAEKFTVSRQIT